MTHEGLKARLLNLVVENDAWKSAPTSLKTNTRCVIESARKLLPRINILPLKTETTRNHRTLRDAVSSDDYPREHRTNSSGNGDEAENRESERERVQADDQKTGHACDDENQTQEDPDTI